MENDSCSSIWACRTVPQGNLQQHVWHCTHTCLTSTLTSTPARLGVTVILMNVNPIVHEVGDDVISDHAVWVWSEIYMKYPFT